LIDSPRARALAPFLPAAIVIAAWLLWSHFEGGYFPETWYPSAIAAVGLLVVTALGTGRILPPSTSGRVALAALAALVAWAFLSLAWSPSPGLGWEAADKLLLLLMVTWTMTLLPWTPRALEIALGAWVAGTVLVCAISLIGASGGSLGDYFIEGRYLDPIGYSNAVSALPVMSLFPALWLCSRRGAGLAARGGFLAAAVFLAEFALLPQSRGAVVGFVIAIVVFVALAPDRLRLIPSLLVLALAVAVSVGPIYHVYTVGIELSEAAEAQRTIPGLHLRPVLEHAARVMLVTSVCAGIAGALLAGLDRGLRVGEAGMRRMRLVVAGTVALVALAGLIVAVANAGRISSDLSDRWDTFKSTKETPATTGPRLTANYSDQRYDYWRVALDQFARTPLAGAGIGSFEGVYSSHRHDDKPSKYVHDIWFRVLAEGGLVAALLLLLLLGAGGVGLAQRWRALDGPGRGLIAVCVAVPVYFLIHASVDWLEEFPALAAPALALPLVGLGLGVEDRGARPGYGPAGRYAALAAACLLALAAAASFAFPYLAQRHLTRGSEIGLADVPAARRELDRAASLNPLSPEPHLRAATILVAAGRTAAARREFGEALAVEDNWYAHLELALLEAEAGRRKAALAQLARARSLDRHDPFIAAAMAKMRHSASVDAARFNSEIRRFEAERFTRPKA